MNKRINIAAVLVLVILAGSGCASHKDIAPVEPSQIAPEAFSTSGELPLPEQWWTVFEDDQLNQLIVKATGENLTIKQAWSRLNHAKALARMSNSGKWPQVNATGSAGRTYYGVNGFNMSTFRPSDTIDQFSGNVSVSYQLDLWGKISSQAEAGMLDYLASRKEVEATAISITNAVVDLYFAIAEQQATLALLEQQIKVNEDFLNLVELRFSQGSASAVDVYQQRLQLQGINNQLVPAKMTMQLLYNQMAVLLGVAPDGSFELSKIDLPQLPELPDTGLPAEVIKKRPDVKAAEMRIYAADKRVAAAIADQYPTISFSAAGGSNTNAWSEVLDRWFINLASNIMGPIFDGGRRAAEVERNRALVEASIYQWKATVLNAAKEVEDALVAEKGQREMLAGLQQQTKLAEATLERARSRYTNGLTNYLTVLTSLQAVQNLERSEINISRQILSGRVKLMTAIGGSWAESLNNPLLATSQEDNGVME